MITDRYLIWLTHWQAEGDRLNRLTRAVHTRKAVQSMNRAAAEFRRFTKAIGDVISKRISRVLISVESDLARNKEDSDGKWVDDGLR
jgi:hypothetical protein